MTQLNETTDIVIVGAGPTGLTAAVRLAQLGVPHVVLDAGAEPSRTSKAALVHASSLEVLAELGVAEALVDAGRRLHSIVMVDRGRVLVRVRLTELPTPFPYGLSVPQSTTEALLVERLARLEGSVRRRSRVDTVRAEGDRQVVEGTVDGAAFAIRARYVIGADGAHSAVRAAVGLDFPGQTYSAQFVLADIALEATQLRDDQATIVLSPQGVTVLGRLPSGNHRIIATVDADADVPEAPDRAYVDALLGGRGVAARTAAEPVWSSRFRIHHRVADRFRVGAVFLAGDAAHIHSPAAGQGMNTGIADAYDLATRLAAVVAGAAPESTLDAYAERRRAAALEVLRFTDRMTKVAMLRNPVARVARLAVARTVGRLGPVQRRIALWVTGLERSPLRADLPSVTSAVDLGSGTG